VRFRGTLAARCAVLALAVAYAAAALRAVARADTWVDGVRYAVPSAAALVVGAALVSLGYPGLWPSLAGSGVVHVVGAHLVAGHLGLRALLWPSTFVDSNLGCVLPLLSCPE